MECPLVCPLQQIRCALKENNIDIIQMTRNDYRKNRGPLGLCNQRESWILLMIALQ
jgi:hypothetical protein